MFVCLCYVWRYLLFVSDNAINTYMSDTTSGGVPSQNQWGNNYTSPPPPPPYTAQPQQCPGQGMQGYSCAQSSMPTQQTDMNMMSQPGKNAGIMGLSHDAY